MALVRTKSEGMLNALKESKALHQTVGGMPYVVVGGKSLRILDGDTYPVKQTVVSLGEAPFGREALIYNPDSTYLTERVNTFIRTCSGSLAPVKILEKVLSFTREHVFEVKADIPPHLKKPWTLPQDKKEESGVVNFDEIVKTHSGVCRHHALWNRHLIQELITHGYLSGRVYYARGWVTDGGHAWAIFVPDTSNDPCVEIDAYLIDSMWQTQPFLIKRDHAKLTSYGRAIDNCIFRYLGNWAPPDFVFRYNFENSTATVKIRRYDKEQTLNAGEVLGRGSFGVVRSLGDNYVVKEFNYSHGFVDCSDDQIRNYTLNWAQDFIQEAAFNSQAYDIGAVYCKLENVKIEEREVVEKEDKKSEENPDKSPPVKTKKKFITSYPKIALLMREIHGVDLDKYKITSIPHFIKVAVALLKAVRRLHENFLHLDIKPANIKIQEDETGEITVQLLDFTVSQYHGSKRRVRDLNPAYHPPEYKGQDYMRVTPLQDCYLVGKTLEACFPANESKSFPETTQHIKGIITKMTAELSQRIDIKNASRAFGVTEIFAEIETPDSFPLNFSDFLHQVAHKRPLFYELFKEFSQPLRARFFARVTEFYPSMINEMRLELDLRDAGFSSELQREYMKYCFVFFQSKFEKEFKLPGDNVDPKRTPLDKWCYCQRFIIELENNAANIISRAGLVVFRITDNLLDTTGLIQLQEVLETPQEFFAMVNNLKLQQEQLNIVMQYLRKKIETFFTAPEFMDGLSKANQAVKQALQPLLYQHFERRLEKEDLRYLSQVAFYTSSVFRRSAKRFELVFAGFINHDFVQGYIKNCVKDFSGLLQLLNFKCKTENVFWILSQIGGMDLMLFCGKSYDNFAKLLHSVPPDFKKDFLELFDFNYLAKLADSIEESQRLHYFKDLLKKAFPHCRELINEIAPATPSAPKQPVGEFKEAKVSARDKGGSLSRNSFSLYCMESASLVPVKTLEKPAPTSFPMPLGSYRSIQSLPKPKR